MTLGLAMLGGTLSACDEEVPPSDGIGRVDLLSSTCGAGDMTVRFSASETGCASEAEIYFLGLDESGLEIVTPIFGPRNFTGELEDSFSVALGTTTVVVSLMCDGGSLASGLLTVPSCESDGGMVDGGVDDSGLDASTADDAMVDAGAGDASMDATIEDSSTDASSTDASSVDATTPDAGASLLGYAYLPTNPASGVGDGQILQYRVLADGSLTAMTPASVPAQVGTSHAAVATVGASRFLYVSNAGSDSVSQFSIGADGGLTALSPATISTGADTQPDMLLASSSYLYVANTQSRSVSQFSIGAGGMLTSLGASVTTGSGDPGSNPAGICELGDHVYVANAGSMEGISVYSRSGTGTLTRLADAAPTSDGYTAIVCATDGMHLYASTLSEVHQFERSGDTLVPLTPASVSAGFGTIAVVVSADGSKLFSLSSLDQTASFYDVSGAGLLSAMTPASVLLADTPTAAAFEPSGHYFFVTGSTAGIYAYSLVGLSDAPRETSTAMGSQSITIIAP